MLRWPWVGLVHVEAMERQYCQHISTLNACLDNERQLATDERQRADVRYADLLARFTMLRLQGATLPEPVTTIERPTQDIVRAAITARAGTNRVLRQAMERQAAADKERGASAEAIVDAIERGTLVHTDESFI